MRAVIAIFLRVKRSLFLCCSILLLASPSWAQDEPYNLTFGLYANENPTVIVNKFRPILNEIQNQFLSRYNKKVSIKIDIARTYQQGINYLVSGRFDIARFGPAAYVIAKSRQENVDAIAVENNKGKDYFYGVLCVNENSPIDHVSDLKSKSFAFGSLNSTVGRYLSQQVLYQNGISSGDLSHFDYLGRHDDVAIAVATGAYDAGGVKISTFNKLSQQGYKLRTILDFKVPTKPWITRAGLNAEIKQQLQTILLEYQNISSMKNLGKQGFLVPKANMYAEIETAIQMNSHFFSAE